MADISQWTGVAANVLNDYLNAENGDENSTADPGNFGVDAFVNEFEDEFPSDPASGELYPNYSPEAQRAAEQKPWGLEFGNRPKVYELNQPAQAQSQGWRIVDLYPNRDVKSEFYRLGGTPAELRILLQATMASRQLLKNNNLIIDFKEWFKLWEEGFPNWQRTDSNFELTGQTPWREPETRPKYREWTRPEGSSIGYRVIEYWPNRQNEKTSYFLTGSDADLVRHILQIEYEGGAGISNATMQSGGMVRRRGQPQIRLFFLEKPEDVEPGYKPIEGEITFRIMDKSDLPESSLPQLTEGDLHQYATKIKELFVGYKWKKGKDMIIYHCWEQGYQLQLLSRNEAEGEILIKQVLNIQGHSFSAKNMKINTAKDPVAAYPTIPAEVSSLGRTRRLPRSRPIATVEFLSAEILLFSWPTPLRLVVDGEIVDPIVPEVALNS